MTRPTLLKKLEWEEIQELRELIEDLKKPKKEVINSNYKWV